MMRVFARTAARTWRTRKFRRSRLRKPFRTNASSTRQSRRERRRITRSWRSALTKSKRNIVCRGTAWLNKSKGWTRLVIEKPFGRDLASAQALNQVAHEHFEEKQIYRIDH